MELQGQLAIVTRPWHRPRDGARVGAHGRGHPRVDRVNSLRTASWRASNQRSSISRPKSSPVGAYDRSPWDAWSGRVIGFRVSARSEYMTGQAPSVDGGLVMESRTTPRAGMSAAVQTCRAKVHW
jgi:hypothetical protein